MKGTWNWLFQVTSHAMFPVIPVIYAVVPELQLDCQRQLWYASVNWIQCAGHRVGVLKLSRLLWTESTSPWGFRNCVYLVRRGIQCSAAILPSIPTLANWSENWSRSSSWSSLISSSSREATPLAVYLVEGGETMRKCSTMLHKACVCGPVTWLQEELDRTNMHFQLSGTPFQPRQQPQYPSKDEDSIEEKERNKSSLVYTVTQLATKPTVHPLYWGLPFFITTIWHLKIP